MMLVLQTPFWAFILGLVACLDPCSALTRRAPSHTSAEEQGGRRESSQQLESDPSVHTLLQQRAQVKGRQTAVESTLHTKLVKKLTADVRNFLFDKSEYDWEHELPTGPFGFNCSEDGLNTSVDCPDEAVDHSVHPPADFEDTNDTWEFNLLTTTDDGEGPMVTNTTTAQMSSTFPATSTPISVPATTVPIAVNASDVEGPPAPPVDEATTSALAPDTTTTSQAPPAITVQETVRPNVTEPERELTATAAVTVTPDVTEPERVSTAARTATIAMSTPLLEEVREETRRETPGTTFITPSTTAYAWAQVTTAEKAPAATTPRALMATQASTDGVVGAVTSTAQPTATAMTSTSNELRYTTPVATDGKPFEATTGALADQTLASSTAIELPATLATQRVTVAATASEQQATTSTNAVADAATSSSTNAQPTAFDPASIFRQRVLTTTTLATTSTPAASTRFVTLDPEAAGAAILQRLR